MDDNCRLFRGELVFNTILPCERDFLFRGAHSSLALGPLYPRTTFLRCTLGPLTIAVRIVPNGPWVLFNGLYLIIEA